MTEIGEGVGIAVPAVVKEKKGDLKVKVVDKCTKKAVEGADVRVEKQKGKTSSSGIAEFKGLVAPGYYGAHVTKHFDQADYIRFITHYPKISWSSKAISKGSGGADVVDGGSAEAEVPIEVYRLVEKVVFKRKQIDLGGADKYGHWWVEIDGSESYGWWPKFRLGSPQNQTTTAPTAPTAPAADAGWGAKISHAISSAIHAVQAAMFAARESAPGQTLFGVEGELNGRDFGGTATTDPHQGDSADAEYQPVINDCRTDPEIKDCMRGFAKSYSGEWSWRFEFGKHCHSFQIEMMDHCELNMFKELK